MPINKNYAKRYSPKLKFQVVLETLEGKDYAQVAKAYGIHPTSITHWKRDFMAKGANLFSEKDIASQYEKKLAKMERLIGQKEIEIALLKNFLGEDN